MQRQRPLGSAWVRRLLLVVGGIAGAIVLSSCQPDAFSFTVNSVVDAVDADPGDGVCEATPGQGDCTLRAAVMEGNAIAGRGTVQLGADAEYTLGLGGAGEDGAASGDLDVLDDLHVVGNGATVDAGGVDRVFDVHTDATLDLDPLVLTGGAVSDAGGGARVRTGAELHLTDVTVTANAAHDGGGIFLESGATAQLDRSTVSDNTAAVYAGGVGVESGGELTATRSTFADNDGPGGANILNGGTITLVSSTVAGGTTGSASAPAGIANGGTLTATGVVVGDQTVGAGCYNAGTVVSLGYNVESTTACGFTDATDSQNTSAGLDPLALWGGSTPTRPPGTASAVKDLIPPGTPGLCDGTFAVDQRDVDRPSGSGCDAGAVEAIPPPSSLSVSVEVPNLRKPWDLAFTPDGTMLLTQKLTTEIDAVVGGNVNQLVQPADAVSTGESGMMGLAVDPDFATNRRIYACFLSTLSGQYDIRVGRFTVNADYTAVTDRVDILTGIERKQPPLTNIGRHGGCRPRFGPDGYLWVTTGDGAIGTMPQDVTALSGKVLRVDTDGSPAPGNNPGAPFRPEIYTYGHRNPQGLTFRPSDGAAFSVEHGPNRDDEVNRLTPGANMGWDPIPGYNESVPMTDLAKFPGAVEAVWSSGTPTIAPSGATFVQGPQWSGWDGALVIAVLKDMHIHVLVLDPDTDAVIAEHEALNGTWGRLRSAVQGPDGNLYLAQDIDGGGILEVVPTP